MIARLVLAAAAAAGVGYLAARVVSSAPRCDWCDRRHWLPCAAQVDAERFDSTCHDDGPAERFRIAHEDLQAAMAEQADRALAALALSPCPLCGLPPGGAS